MKKQKHLTTVFLKKLTIITFFVSVLYFTFSLHSAAGIDNPLGNIEDIGVVIARIIQAVVGLGGVVAVGFLVVGGFIYITSGGDEKQIEQGKKSMLGAIIGLALVLLALAVVQFIIKGMEQSSY